MQSTSWSDTLIGGGATLDLFYNILGETPLMAAATCGYEKAVKALLDAGANKEATDEDGQTALSKAADYYTLESAAAPHRCRSGHAQSARPPYCQ